MKYPVSINLVVEDILSDAVAKKLLKHSGRPFWIGATYGLVGSGYIKKNIARFNDAAKSKPFLVLTDLDQVECPPVLLKNLLTVSKHPNLILVIPVREVEAWLLGHRSAFSSYFKIPAREIPADPEKIDDPKRFLISLVSRAKNKEARLDVIPRKGTTSKQGPNYNGRLIEFVERSWDPKIAVESSESLRRAFARIRNFVPQ